MKRRDLRIPREEVVPLLIKAGRPPMGTSDASVVDNILDLLHEVPRLRAENSELRDRNKIPEYQREAKQARANALKAYDNARTARIEAADAEEARRAAERARSDAVSACDTAVQTMRAQVEEAERARDGIQKALEAERAEKRETLRMFKNPAMVKSLRSKRNRLRRRLANTTEALAIAVDAIRHLGNDHPETVDAAERAVAKPLRRDSEAGQRARALEADGLPVFEDLLDLYRRGCNSSDETDLSCPPRHQPDNAKRQKKRSKERRDIRELRDLLANQLQGLSYAFDVFWILLDLHREAGRTRDVVEAVMRDIREILVQDPTAARFKRTLKGIYGEDYDFDEEEILELYRRRSSRTTPLDAWDSSSHYD